MVDRPPTPSQAGSDEISTTRITTKDCRNYIDVVHYYGTPRYIARCDKGYNSEAYTSALAAVMDMLAHAVKMDPTFDPADFCDEPYCALGRHTGDKHSDRRGSSWVMLYEESEL